MAVQTGFYLEVDSSPVRRDICLELSFIDISSTYNRALNGPLRRLNRHRLDVRHQDYIKSFHDPDYLRIFILYDEQSYLQFGLLRIKEVGWCNSNYRPSPSEVIHIITLPYLLEMDEQLKRLDI